jgi:Na+/proline symporter
LSSLLGWDIIITNILMGGLLIIYTVKGGARAVAYTQEIQLVIIFIGMFIVGYKMVSLLPEGVGFSDALKVSGAAGKLNVITTGFKDGSFDWSDKYNIWSGVIGGFFLALSYFGTDQSQVGRYLTAKNTTESKLGLLMNGVVKVPMQFFILLLGALLFTFYQFKPSPVFHNRGVEVKAEQSVYKDSLLTLKAEYGKMSTRQAELSNRYIAASHADNSAGLETIKDSVRANNKGMDSVRTAYKSFVKKALPFEDNNDTNYVFLRFVIDYLPVGLIGLLIAIIFLAAWGSIAAALNSLASSTMIDFHRRFNNPDEDKSEEQSKKEYRLSMLYTLMWGIFCIGVAQFANRMGSLIEAVNVLGSLFYGVILGIFLVAFYVKRVGAKAIFWSAIISEIIIVSLFILNQNGSINLSFLWLNAVGALLVVFISMGLNEMLEKKDV